MSYRFKLDQEAIWFVLVAAGTVILQALATLDVDKVTDWRVWVVGLLAATIRAAAGAALSLLSAPRPLPPTLADEILALSQEDRAALGQEVAQRGEHQPPPPPPLWSDPHHDVRSG